MVEKVLNIPIRTLKWPEKFCNKQCLNFLEAIVSQIYLTVRCFVTSTLVEKSVLLHKVITPVTWQRVLERMALSTRDWLHPF